MTAAHKQLSHHYLGMQHFQMARTKYKPSITGKVATAIDSDKYDANFDISTDILKY